jgi:hypothetical protein
MARSATRLGPDEQAVMTPGAAVAGMRLHSRGFAKRPLSFTPPFCANPPLALWWRDGIDAERVNRFQLGRPREAAQAEGCHLVLEARALAVCTPDGIALRFHHLDPTRFRLTGAYLPDREAPARGLTHGSSQDQRPARTPAVLALLVAQAGGVPWGRPSWDGTPADPRLCPERAEAWLRAFTNPPRPRSRVAEATLSCEDHAAQRAQLGWIPRVPATRQGVAPVLSQAPPGDTGPPVAPPPRSPPRALGHSGMVQRWLVGAAPAAWERAAATRKPAPQHANAALPTPLCHLHAPRFGPPHAAHEALAVWATAWKDHRVASSHLTAPQRDAGTGRPPPSPPRQASAWHSQAPVHTAEPTREQAQPAQACWGLGTQSAARARRAPEVRAADKGPSHVAGGLRVLKAPRFFGSSRCVQPPSRLAGVLLVLTLALLVYAGAPRRLRAP